MQFACHYNVQLITERGYARHEPLQIQQIWLERMLAAGVYEWIFNSKIFML